VKVTLEGMPRLRATLSGIPETGRRVVQREVKRAALNVEAGAKRRAPVDTGRLRNSITHRVEPDGLSAVVGTNVEYAPHVEFGTRFQRAQPYLVPALEAERNAFHARLKAAFPAAYRRTD
jgi:HK97 gp10 family phage protein